VAIRLLNSSIIESVIFCLFLATHRDGLTFGIIEAILRLDVHHHHRAKEKTTYQQSPDEQTTQNPQREEPFAMVGFTEYYIISNLDLIKERKRITKM